MKGVEKMGTMCTVDKEWSEMTKYEKIKQAFCYCSSPLEQSTLRCMWQGTVAYDEQFVAKYGKR